MRKTPIVFLLLLALLMTLPPAARGQGTPRALSLRDAAALSLQNNLDLKISALTFEQSHARLLGAEGRFDLNLNLSALRARTETPSVSTLEAGTGSSSLIESKWNYAGSLSKTFGFGSDLLLSYNYLVVETNSVYARLRTVHQPSVTASLTQPLLKTFTPSYFTRDLTQARYSVEIAESQHGEKLVATLAKTMTLYLDLLRSREELKIQQATWEESKDLLEAVKAKQSIGRASQLDRMEAESGAEQNRESFLRAQSSFQSLKEDFALQVYADGAAEFELGESVDQVPPPPPRADLKQWIQEALNKRLESRRSLASIEQAKAAEDAAFVDRLPEVDIKPSATLSSLDRNLNRSHQELLEMKHPSWSLEVSIEHPIMSYGSRGAHREKQIRLEQEELKHQQKQRDIALEVKKSLRDIELGQERLKALGQVLEAENEKFEAQQIRFRNGQVSTYELNRSLADRRNAELEKLKGAIEYRKALYRLAEARGILLEELGISAVTKSEP